MQVLRARGPGREAPACGRRTLEAREMALKGPGQPDGAAPYGQPTENYPAKLLAGASSATAVEPSLRGANRTLVSSLL